MLPAGILSRDVYSSFSSIWKFFQMYCRWQRAGTVRCSCVKKSVNAVSFAPLGLRAFARGMNDLTSFSQSRREETSSGHEALVGGLTKKRIEKSNKQPQRRVPPAQTAATRERGVSLARLTSRLLALTCLLVPHRCGRVFKPAAQL